MPVNPLDPEQQQLQQIKPKTVGGVSSLNTLSAPAPKATPPTSSTAGSTIGDVAKGALNYGNNIAKTLVGGAGQVVAPIGDTVIGAANLALGNDPNSREGGFFAGTKAANAVSSEGLTDALGPLDKARLAAGKVLGSATGASPLATAPNAATAPAAPAPAPAATPATPAAPTVGSVAAGAGNTQVPFRDPEVPVPGATTQQDGSIIESKGANGERSFSDNGNGAGVPNGSVTDLSNGNTVSLNANGSTFQVQPAAQFVGQNPATVGATSQDAQRDPNVLYDSRGVTIGRQPSQEEQTRLAQINGINRALADNRGGIAGRVALTGALDRLLGNDVDLKKANTESEISTRDRNSINAARNADAQTALNQQVGRATIGQTVAQTARLGTENQAGQISVMDALRLNAAQEAYRQNPTEQNESILRALQGKERQEAYGVSESQSTDENGQVRKTPFVFSKKTGQGSFQYPNKDNAIPALPSETVVANAAKQVAAGRMTKEQANAELAKNGYPQL